MGQHIKSFEQVGTRHTRQQKYFLDEPGRRLLFARYDGRSETITELAERLRVPRKMIKRWASNLGLARNKDRAWTQEEIAYLERSLHTVSIATIATKLGRTQIAIKNKARRLGLNKMYQEGYTLSSLCMGLGCNHKKVTQWIENGWLKGHRRHTERLAVQGGDVWYFSDEAIRQLVKHHPQEIDPRRCDWIWVVDILVGGLGNLSDARGKADEKDGVA